MHQVYRLITKLPLCKYVYNERRESLCVKLGGGYEGVDGREENDVSKADIFVNEVNMPSAGARNFRCLLGPEILVVLITHLQINILMRIQIVFTIFSEVGVEGGAELVNDYNIRSSTVSVLFWWGWLVKVTVLPLQVSKLIQEVPKK